MSGFWVQFCDLLGRDDLKSDKRFATNPERVRNHDDLFPILQKTFVDKPADEWLALFEKNGLPCGLVLSVAEALEHPQVRAREISPGFPAPGLWPGYARSAL